MRRCEDGLLAGFHSDWREGGELKGCVYRCGGETHVISAAVIVWKKSATEHKALERKLPMVLQRARRPRKSEQAAKKPPMRTKANMKRVK